MFTILTNTHFDFMGKRRLFYAISLALLLAGAVSMIAKGGLRMGVDFAGGRLIELRLSQLISIQEMRSIVGQAGFGDAELQGVQGSNDILIRIPLSSADEAGLVSPSQKIRDAIAMQRPGVTAELMREENVGAKVGGEIRKQGFLAILVSFALILIYIAVRFEPLFGLAGVIATFHDVLAVLAVFSLLNKEISMSVVAALMTIAGYSINDTVVIFDRVREQLARLRRESFANVINLSINQMLSRTIITNSTVFFTTLSLLFFGGEVLRDFALAMTIGAIAGSYSTIFVAGALVLDLRRSREAKAKVASA